MNYLIVYDFPTDYPNLRVKINKTCLNYGLLRLQYSTFFGRLTKTNVKELAKRIYDLIEEKSIDFRIIAVCQECLEKSMAILKYNGIDTKGPVGLAEDPHYNIVSHIDKKWAEDIVVDGKKAKKKTGKRGTGKEDNFGYESINEIDPTTNINIDDIVVSNKGEIIGDLSFEDMIKLTGANLDPPMEGYSAPENFSPKNEETIDIDININNNTDSQQKNQQLEDQLSKNQPSKDQSSKDQSSKDQSSKDQLSKEPNIKESEIAKKSNEQNSELPPKQMFPENRSHDNYLRGVAQTLDDLCFRSVRTPKTSTKLEQKDSIPNQSNQQIDPSNSPEMTYLTKDNPTKKGTKQRKSTVLNDVDVLII